MRSDRKFERFRGSWMKKKARPKRAYGDRLGVNVSLLVPMSDLSDHRDSSTTRVHAQT